MNHGYSGGKRQREINRDQRNKEKEDRLRRNRSRPASSGGDIAASPETLAEVPLADIVLGVPSRPRRGTTGPVKLFVGGLSWDTTTDILREAFARFGAIVEATVIPDRDTGRSRGFGFVTFENPKDAEQAIKEMDGAELDRRTLKVNRAEAR
jgi:hypothetical protein